MGVESHFGSKRGGGNIPATIDYYMKGLPEPSGLAAAVNKEKAPIGVRN